MLFSRQCPACNKMIAFRYIRTWLKCEQMQCPYCCARLSICSRIRLFNSILIGMLSGIVVAVWTSFTALDAVLLAVLLIVLCQKYLDVLFSLEEVKDED